MYIKIDNKKIVIDEAKTFKQRLCGLIGKTNIKNGMLFKNCNSIHTFLMKENIDVIGLNIDNTIICKYENLSKNKIIKVKNKIRNTSILELPSGSSNKLMVGNKIKFHK